MAHTIKVKCGESGCNRLIGHLQIEGRIAQATSVDDDPAVINDPFGDGRIDLRSATDEPVALPWLVRCQKHLSLGRTVKVPAVDPTDHLADIDAQLDEIARFEREVAAVADSTGTMICVSDLRPITAAEVQLELNEKRDLLTKLRQLLPESSRAITQDYRQPLYTSTNAILAALDHGGPLFVKRSRDA